ncbi:MAG TPA: hypothetical protein VFS39_16375 [Nitrospira sp.]|nr:hypothetical protein [Nitrospira sp.]
MKPVVIFAATRWEFRAVQRAFSTAHGTTIAGLRAVVAQAGGCPYWLVQTGIGPDAAARGAKAVMNETFVGSVLSAGFACSLGASRVADVLLGTDVRSVRRDDTWAVVNSSLPCDSVLRERLLSAAQQARLQVAAGPIVSAPVVVGSAHDKRELSRLTGAAGLDMESWALGSVAVAQGVPFGIVRTVSDAMDEDLPLDFNLFLKPAGWLGGLRALLMRPGSLRELNRLRRQSRLASDRLSEVFARYIDCTVRDEAIPQ